MSNLEFAIFSGHRDANRVRANIFEKKYTKSGKVIDMALLPPCQSVLILHSKRANYVARLWKSSLTNWIEPTDISENDWSSDGSTVWVDEIFPREVEEIYAMQQTITDVLFEKKGKFPAKFDNHK